MSNSDDENRQPPRTVIFKRKKGSTDVYESSGRTLGELLLQGYGAEVKVTIEPHMTVRERRREVLRRAMNYARVMSSESYNERAELDTRLDELEAIDRGVDAPEARDPDPQSQPIAALLASVSNRALRLTKCTYGEFAAALQEAVEKQCAAWEPESHLLLLVRAISDLKGENETTGVR